MTIENIKLHGILNHDSDGKIDIFLVCRLLNGITATKGKDLTTDIIKKADPNNVVMNNPMTVWVPTALRGRVRLEVEVWDKDKLSGNDFCGRFWVELDHAEGKDEGQYTLVPKLGKAAEHSKYKHIGGTAEIAFQIELESKMQSPSKDPKVLVYQN